MWPENDEIDITTNNDVCRMFLNLQTGEIRTGEVIGSSWIPGTYQNGV